MSGSKSPIKNSSSVSLYANNLTKSLTAKISGALGVTFLLLIIMGGMTFFNISEAKSVTNNAAISQNQAEQLGIIHKILEAEQNYILALLVNPTLPDEFTNYEQSYRDAYFILASQRNKDYFNLYEKHNRLLRGYQALSAEIRANPNDPTLAAKAARLNEENATLEGLANQTIEQQNAETKSAINKALDIQNSGFSQILFLLLLALIVTTGLTWFVISNVIQPLSRLNNQLNELLWEQTEHLTDRLNQLQFTINTANDKFTAVRHDLKSPLSNIKGLAELTLLTTSPNGDDTHKNLHHIIQVTDKSTEMISQVLATRQAELDLQMVYLPEMFDKILQLVDVRLFSIKREIKLDKAVVDPTLMEHALLNLISNARKFSALGIGVGSGLVRKPGSVGEMEVELWVWNDGALISAEDRNEIFKPGRQTAEGKKAGGHGLGLSIVKTIAEQHNGRVSVDSHEKVGTTFRIILPLVQAEG